MQQALFAPVVSVLFEVDSAAKGLDGRDLKRVAHGDDRRDYAVKPLDTHPLLPLSEWLCYHLWRACGLATPDFAVLTYIDGRPPAFGSRMELSPAQLPRAPESYTIAGFFKPHAAELGRTYPLDAFITNPDRHGRNFLVRRGLTGESLLAIDFSRAALVSGEPFGAEPTMTARTTAGRPCNSQEWWRHFRDRLSITPDAAALHRACELPESWMHDTIHAAPAEWRTDLDIAACCDFWQQCRGQRAEFSRRWLTL